MSRADKEFQVEYSYWLEYMLYTFWRRVDVCINISLIVLGTSAVATFSISTLIGLAVALLAAINVVVQPLRKSMIACAQSAKFSQLLNDMSSLSDEELSRSMSALRETNSDVVGMLVPLAYNRAAICTDLKPTHVYTKLNKLAGHFIGDLPDSRP